MLIQSILTLTSSVVSLQNVLTALIDCSRVLTVTIAESFTDEVASVVGLVSCCELSCNTSKSLLYGLLILTKTSYCIVTAFMHDSSASVWPMACL